MMTKEEKKWMETQELVNLAMMIILGLSFLLWGARL